MSGRRIGSALEEIRAIEQIDEAKFDKLDRAQTVAEIKKIIGSPHKNTDALVQLLNQYARVSGDQSVLKLRGQLFDAGKLFDKIDKLLRSV